MDPEGLSIEPDPNTLVLSHVLPNLPNLANREQTDTRQFVASSLSGRYVRWSLFFVSCGMNSIIRSVHSTCITSSNVLRFFEKIVFLFLSYRERSGKFASLSLSNRMNNRFGSSLVEPFKEAFAIFSLELRKKSANREAYLL